MLNNISWASYAYATSIILGIYYLLIILIFYKKELLNLILHQKEFVKPPFDNNIFPNQTTTSTNEERFAEKETNTDTQELLLSLQSLIKKAGVLHYPKEELLLSVQLRLQNYPALKASRLKNSISIYIREECQNNCSIHLSEEEVSVLWGVEVGGAS